MISLRSEVKFPGCRSIRNTANNPILFFHLIVYIKWMEMKSGGI